MKRLLASPPNSDKSNLDFRIFPCGTRAIHHRLTPSTHNMTQTLDATVYLALTSHTFFVHPISFENLEESDKGVVPEL